MQEIQHKATGSISKIWYSVLLYFIIVTVLQLVAAPSMLLMPQLLLNRFFYAAAFGLVIILKKYTDAKRFAVLNFMAVYGLLTFLYGETTELNTLFFPKIDAALSHADTCLFGFQPALQFSEVLNACFWSELFYFGYFSYYLMPVAILFLLYKNCYGKIEEFGFVIITSFLVYYLLFIFFPAAGPQFYFPYPDNAMQSCGVFGYCIRLIQKYGEGPTGAFPSSHVAVSCIIILWLTINFKKWVKYFLPVVIILIFSTVYIKAHYAVDVIAGVATAPVVYWIVMLFFRLISKKTIPS